MMNEFSFKEGFHFENSDIFYEFSKSFHDQTTPNANQTKINGLPKVQKIIFAFFYIIMFFFGLFANIIVITVYMVANKFKKNSNLLINLCISDILILVVCMPIAITDLFSINGQWYYGFIYCKFNFI